MIVNNKSIIGCVVFTSILLWISKRNHTSTTSYRRTLWRLSRYHNPETVGLRHNTTNNNELNNKNAISSRQLNILSLGGSKTFGSGVDTTETFTYVLGQHLNAARADNLGIPATGSFHSSMCIQSMLRDYGHTNNVEQDVIYDVVILEFSTNEDIVSKSSKASLRLLVHRIRLRYPDALIIYVHSSRFEFLKRIAFLKRNKKANQRFSVIKRAIDEVGGVLYSLPIPKSADEVAIIEEWFQEDKHHFSAKGHYQIALDLGHIINERMIADWPRDGTWGRGDRCYSWFLKKGEIPTEVKLSGGTMNQFRMFKGAYEVSQPNTAVIEFPVNEGSVVYMNYMTIGLVQQYPSVQITSTGGISTQVFKPMPITDNYHFTKLANLGRARSNKIVLSVTPIEEKGLPFRIVGVTSCPACDDIAENVKIQMGNI